MSTILDKINALSPALRVEFDQFLARMIAEDPKFEEAVEYALDEVSRIFPPPVPAAAACVSCGQSSASVPLLRIKHPVTNLLEWHCTDVRDCYDRRGPRPLARLAEDQPAVTR